MSGAETHFEYSDTMFASTARPLSGSPRLVLLLCAGQFMAQFDRFLFAGAMPYVKVDLGLGDTALGLVEGTAFAVVYALASLVIGRFGDPSRQRWFILGGLGLWTLGSLGTGLARNLGELAGVRMLLALGEAAFTPAAISMIVNAASGTQIGRPASWFTASSTLGRASAVFVAGLLMTLLIALAPPNAPAPWRMMFGLTILPNLVLVGLLAWTRHAPQGSRGTAATNGDGIKVWLTKNMQSAAAYGLAGVAPILLIQSVAAWYPALCARLHGIEPARAALLVGAVTVVSSPLGQLLGGWLNDRCARIRANPVFWILVVMCSALPPLALLPHVRSIGFTLGALAYFNLALGVASLLALAAIQTIFPTELRIRGNAIFLATVTLVGLGAGPALVGMISDAGQASAEALSYALVATGLFALALGFVATLLSRTPQTADVSEGRS
jgi:MFS family permease